MIFITFKLNTNLPGQISVSKEKIKFYKTIKNENHVGENLVSPITSL